MNHDMEGQHRPLARSDAGGEAAPSLGGYPGEGGSEHGLRGGTSVGEPDSRDTRPDRATRFVETTRGTLSYTELAPLLADRVAAVEQHIALGGYAEGLLDESLLLDIHHRICSDLVPAWAGRWRDIEVSVGRLHPPLPHGVPVMMRDFVLDLQARWQGAVEGDAELTVEFLAFAEGRFLTIHPFRDFNGRTIRLFISELLRRLDLPETDPTPESEADKQAYFLALEAADRGDWTGLMQIWQQRLGID